MQAAAAASVPAAMLDDEVLKEGVAILSIVQAGEYSGY